MQYLGQPAQKQISASTYGKNTVNTVYKISSYFKSFLRYRVRKKMLQADRQTGSNNMSLNLFEVVGIKPVCLCKPQLSLQSVDFPSIRYMGLFTCFIDHRQLLEPRSEYMSAKEWPEGILMIPKFCLNCLIDSAQCKWNNFGWKRH